MYLYPLFSNREPQTRSTSFAQVASCRIAGLFPVPTHFDQIFFSGVTRISDSSASIFLTSNSPSPRTSLARPFHTASESSLSPVLASQASMVSDVLGSSQCTTAIDYCSLSRQLSFGCARLCCLELPRILLWDEICHNADSIDHVLLQQKGRWCLSLPPSARSLVVTLALPFPLVSERFHLIASRLAALPYALCVLVLPSPSVNPTARSEGFVSASAQQDRTMKTLTPAAPEVLAAEAQAIGPTPAPTGCALAFFVSQCLFKTHSTSFCAVPGRHSHCSQALLQTLPRPWSSSTPVDVRWALVLLRHNRCFQGRRPAGPRKSARSSAH